MESNLKPSVGISPMTRYSLAIFAALGMTSIAAFAAATANDTAANYSGGSWGTTPPNSGTGFGAWSISLNNANNPPYVGTYLDTSSAVKSGGYSWGTYANGGGNNGSISITRGFTAGASGSSSLYDQTFSIQLSSDGVGNGSGGPPNSELQLQVGNAFSFSYLGTGSDNFLFSVDGGAGTTTPIGFTQLHAGLAISLAVSGALNSPTESYIFSVAPVAGGSALFTQSGTFDSSTYNTSDFNYLDSNSTGNGYFNNPLISVETVPEPSTIVLGAAGGLATLLLLRRRS